MKPRTLLFTAIFLLVHCLSVFGLTRTPIPGATYGERLVSGERAYLFWGSHFETHVGRIPLPPEEIQAGGAGPLYHRITNIGGFKIAGQSHAGLGTWEYIHGQGWSLKRPACGVSPVIYDAAGVLHISDCSIGSQGWRYVSDFGQLVTGDATYADLPNRIWEWTEHGDWRFGQCATGCCAINLKLKDRRLLEPGDCRFVRYHLSGQTFAVTMAKFTENQVVEWVGGLSELGSLPAETPDSEPPPPPPPPQTPPDWSPFYGYAERRWQELNAAQLGHIEQIDAFFRIVGEWHHDGDNREYGLLVQAPGRSNHKGFSEDYLTYKDGQGVVWSADVVVGIGGSGAAIWRSTPTREERQEAFGIPPVPGGAPKPPVENFEARIKKLEVIVAHLDAHVRETEEELRGLLRESMKGFTDLAGRLERLEQGPVLTEALIQQKLEAFLNKALSELVVQGSTSRTWGHTHKIDLRLQRVF